MSTKKRLGSQAKEVIANVYHRLKFEAQNGVEKLTDARWRTAKATGVTEATVTRILKEERQASIRTRAGTSEIRSPSRRKRKRPMSPTHCKLEDFDLAALRRTLLSFYKLHLELKEVPTLSKLKQVLSECIGFDGYEESLQTILMQSGYECFNIDEDQKALIEKHESQMLRLTYLKQLQKYRNEGRYIVFTGESSVNTAHIQNKFLKDVLGLPSVHKKNTRGMPIIILHAGGCDGFVPNALLMYKANSDNEENPDHYKNWLTKQLLPNLPENSVIVMNDSTYNKVLPVIIPNSNSSKNDIQTWLLENNVPYEETMNKRELYDLILQNRDKCRTFMIDAIIKSKGFEILQMPPYHPELNPIEKIWGIIKNDISNKKVGQNIASLMVLIITQIQKINYSEWENTCRLVEETEQQYMQYFDMDYEFIIHVNDGNSDESDSV